MSEVLLAGAGAIGSRFEALVGNDVTLTFADRERVAPENVGVGAFDARDVGAEKVDVLAARRRGRGGGARVLAGDLRYSLRPGLARALDGAVLALDRPAAVRDAAAVLWEGRPGLPVLVLGCGADGGGYQARLFVVGRGACPVCLFGDAERRADRASEGASCGDSSAPRASAGAAGAAANAGARILAGWFAGDPSLAACRVQQDGSGDEFVIRMPDAPTPRCPVPHLAPSEPVVELAGGVRTVTLEAMAERALEVAGDDAWISLGRRGIPLCGLYCPRCRTTAPAPPLLLPAAQRAARRCGCDQPLRPLAERATLCVRELLAVDLAPLTLAAWGAGPGEELLVSGSRGQFRLRCDFAWSDLDVD
jgi:hypothetical protein